MKKCPYCAEEIQDAAIVCRFCNRDLMNPGVKPGVQVIEQTSKRYKAVQGIGCLGIIIGLMLIMLSTSEDRHWAGMIFFLSLVTLFSGMVGAWWNHG